MITLYDYELSGNCYKVRLLLNILGLEWKTRRIDFHPGREHKSDWFLRLNPLGQVPVLEDGDLGLRDAQAILTYLAAQYDRSGRWYPAGDARTLGEIAMWLAFAEGITATASAARLAENFLYDLDVDAARAGAHRLFRVLDEHLWFAEQEGRDWLCAPGHPTSPTSRASHTSCSRRKAGSRACPTPRSGAGPTASNGSPGFTLMSGVFPAGAAV